MQSFRGRIQFHNGITGLSLERHTFHVLQKMKMAAGNATRVMNGNEMFPHSTFHSQEEQSPVFVEAGNGNGNLTKLIVNNNNTTTPEQGTKESKVDSLDSGLLFHYTCV